MKILSALALLLTFTLSARAETHFGLNDLSVLIPLPRNAAEASAMLSPLDTLIPRAQLRALFNGGPDNSFTMHDFELLRVIAFRLDPCFNEGGPGCRHQIRLVIQPVRKMSVGYISVDVPVHAFFDFNESDWQDVLAAWRGIANDDPAHALQINPRILSEGLTGPQWQAWRAWLTRFCTPARLTRLTSSATNRLGTSWTFLGFNIAQDGAFTPIQIPRILATRQTFGVDLSTPQEFFGGLVPAPPNEDHWDLLLKYSVAARGKLSPDERDALMTEAVVIENPRGGFNPGNIDCASCHVAQLVRLWSAADRPGAVIPAADAARFTSPWNLENKSTDPFNTDHIRAFGYFNDEVVISQRVVDETAVVAESLSKTERRKQRH